MTALRAERQALMPWLVLAALLFRALIPAGLMPGTAADARHGAVLVLCSGGLLKTVDGQPGKPAAHAVSQCAFAASATPALPPASASHVAAVFAPEAVPALPGIAPATTARRTLPPARAPPAFS